jgi:hypothetical protein
MLPRLQSFCVSDAVQAPIIDALKSIRELPRLTELGFYPTTHLQPSFLDAVASVSKNVTSLICDSWPSPQTALMLHNWPRLRTLTMTVLPPDSKSVAELKIIKTLRELCIYDTDFARGHSWKGGNVGQLLPGVRVRLISSKSWADGVLDFEAAQVV